MINRSARDEQTCTCGGNTQVKHGFRTEKLSKTTPQDFSPVSGPGEWRLTCSFKLDLYEKF